MSTGLSRVERKLILPPAAEQTETWKKEFVENYWMKLGDTSQIHTVNPFSRQTKYDLENPHVFVLDLMRRPEYFHFTAKHIFSKVLPPYQLAILYEMWIRPFPMLIGSRGLGKSFLGAFYIMLRALFFQGSRIIICGAAFRQAKVVFDYCQDIWEKAPVLRDLADSGKGPGRNGPRRDVDRCTLRIGDSLIVAIPLGDGTKIRGQRANIILADEFASIPVDIFETVVRGFAAVSKDPIQALQRESRADAMKVLGAWDDAVTDDDRSTMMSNQTIISGTAYYAFNHFYSYWKQYKGIIESRGDVHKLREVFGGDPPETFNWKDYCVMRIPYSKIPKGPMDANQVAQGRVTMHAGIFAMEFEACWATDSNGFFKRSLIEGCVVGRPGFPIVYGCGEVRFTAVLRGKPQSEYVIAVDPASENDNFSITVLELWSDHRRIVHCWTTTRARFKAKLAKGLVDGQEKDFYGYAARKIRDLRKSFHCTRIGLDSQGGGVSIMEALQDPDKMHGGEQPFYPVIIDGEEQDTDHLPGEHIIEIINFAKADWVRDANQGMRKDFEDKVLLFPQFDSALLGLAIEEDKLKNRVVVDQSDSTVEKLYDTLEDCVMEIEDLKDELATIVHTQTGTTMRDRWDTPETKGAGGKKGRLRKDRYSSLLMANMIARVMQRAPAEIEYQEAGGFAGELKGKPTSGQMWSGQHWANQNANDGSSYGAVVTRRR